MTTRNGANISAGTATRSLSEISEQETIRLSIDLVSAARRNIGFLRTVAESRWLQQKSTVLEAIRRYDELWMPLISDLTVGSTAPMVLPPLDIEWVWYCHTLNPVIYKQYCESRFSKLIGKAAIFDEENEEYAYMRCRELWIRRYPSEPFDNESDSDVKKDPGGDVNEDLLNEVVKQRYLYLKFSEPYMIEVVHLIAARQRYKGFLFLLQILTDGSSPLVPTSDVLLMLLTHQSYPTAYAGDVKEMEGEMGKVVGVWESVKETEVEETKKLWEKEFDQPYEKAGAGFLALDLEGVDSVKPPVCWDVSDTDVNTNNKSMVPRFLLEVCVFARLNSKMKAVQMDTKSEFLRLRMVRCHRELKIDKPISHFPLDSWKKAWHLYCEFGTRGIVLELRRHGGGSCFKGSGSSSLLGTIVLLWNDLLRAPSLTLGREVDQQVRVVASITPPVQAPYLLKCVPDRVTDDSGAMISDVILRMNSYRPQEGRWLSRTVLDHAGRECFVVRIRAEKVVATATPKEPSEQWKASWYFSTGDELMIRWESSSALSSLSFQLQNQSSPDSSAKLLKGRKMQYKVKKTSSKSKNEETQNKEEEGDSEEEEEGFVTLIRLTEENPNGKATALLNWKLLVVEVSPEEDAVLVLLLCISILRSVSEMRKEDVGSLLIRRRLKEAKVGARDWGSVLHHNPSSSSSISSPYLQPWYWNAKAVMASDGAAPDHITRQPASAHSPAEGGENLYKRGIIT